MSCPRIEAFWSRLLVLQWSRSHTKWCDCKEPTLEVFCGSRESWNCFCYTQLVHVRLPPGSVFGGSPFFLGGGGSKRIAELWFVWGSHPKVVLSSLKHHLNGPLANGWFHEFMGAGEGGEGEGAQIRPK